MLSVDCPVFFQLTKRVYKGIPEAMRGHVWCQLLDLPRLKAEQSGIYEVRKSASLLFMSISSVKNMVYDPTIVVLSLSSEFGQVRAVDWLFKGKQMTCSVVVTKTM